MNTAILSIWHSCILIIVNYSFTDRKKEIKILPKLKLKLIKVSLLNKLESLYTEIQISFAIQMLNPHLFKINSELFLLKI